MSTVILTPSAKQPLSFTLPTLAAAGALAGRFVGAANGSVPVGILGGAQCGSAVFNLKLFQCFFNISLQL